MLSSPSTTPPSSPARTRPRARRSLGGTCLSPRFQSPTVSSSGFEPQGPALPSPSSSSSASHVCNASSGPRPAPGSRPSPTHGPWMRQRPAQPAKNELYRDLFSALATQFTKESLPWIKELVEPLWAGPPTPLTDTMDPTELADADSRFTTINNVNIHYKTWTVANGSAQHAAQQPVPLQRAHHNPAAAAAAGGQQQQQEEAPAVLMLHGFNGSVFNFRMVAQQVAEGISAQAGGAPCTAVAFDRPPFGLSERPTGKWEHGAKTDPYTLSGGVELVRSIVKKLGLKRVVLVGHSSGAPIALEVAAKYPDLVAGLVLVAPAVAVDSKGLLSTLDFGMLARFAWTRMLLSFDGPGVAFVRQQIRKREEEVRAGKFGGVYADDSMFATPQVIDEFLKPLRAHDWDVGSLNMVRYMEMGPPSTPWEDIRAPVMVVHGEEDTIIQPEYAHAVTRALRDARVHGHRGPCASPVAHVDLPQCGHIPMEEKPLEFTSAVVDFVSKQCLPRRQAQQQQQQQHQQQPKHHQQPHQQLHHRQQLHHQQQLHQAAQQQQQQRLPVPAQVAAAAAAAAAAPRVPVSV